MEQAQQEGLEMKLSKIGMLWMEGPLSFLEQLCVKSFVDAGHEVVLYHYGPLQNVPHGVTLADASQILSRDGALIHARTGSPALHSDLFRYKMIEKSPGMIWADTDAYCLRPFETENGHFYGWESDKHVNGGVLGFPPDSETFKQLREFTSDEYAIPSYYGEDYRQRLIAAKEAGNPVHAGDQPWGVWGPHAITHFLHVTGEIKYAKPRSGLYPFSFKYRRDMLKPDFDTTGILTEETMSIHFYGRRMRRRILEAEGGAPHPRSLIGRLLVKHEIDPAAAPIPDKLKPVKEKTPAKQIQPKRVTDASKANLTDMANEAGLNIGVGRQRYTELYHLLFQPLRDQKLNLLNLGDGGGDETQVQDLPRIQLWLDYFSKAKIFHMDKAQRTSADERVTSLVGDMEDVDAIREAVEDLPPVNIIVDEATHASHHQQFCFLGLWDKLASGGVYAIENLRWQPRAIERPGLTKTGELFYGFQMSQVFSHTDPQIEEDFNMIAPEISGCFVFQVGYNRSRRHQFAVIHKR